MASDDQLRLLRAVGRGDVWRAINGTVYDLGTQTRVDELLYLSVSRWARISPAERRLITEFGRLRAQQVELTDAGRRRVGYTIPTD